MAPVDWDSLEGLAHDLSLVPSSAEVLDALASRAHQALGLTGVCVHHPHLPMAVAPEQMTGLEALDALQHEQGGPGPEAREAGVPVAVADLASVRDRWPRFAATALDVGVRALVAVPVPERGAAQVVTCVYSVQVHPWSSEELGVLRGLAAAAAVHVDCLARTLAHTERVAQLQQALDSRILLEQAKGVLAAREGIGVDEAFERMRQLARRTSVPLGSVADAVVRQQLRLPSQRSGPAGDS